MWATKKAAIKKSAQNGRQYQANLRRERERERERDRERAVQRGAGREQKCPSGSFVKLPSVTLRL